MRIAIVEDEKAAREQLALLLNEMGPEYQVLAFLESVQDSVAWLRENEVDLLFLDVQLADALSFEIFEHVSFDGSVIFTTAFDHYALRAFELNSVAYLLKPITRQKVVEALEKLKQWPAMGSKDYEGLAALLKPLSYRQRFMVAAGEKLISVAVEEIAYFHAFDKYCFLITREARRLPISATLERLQQELDPQQFYRVNRNYTCSFTAIKDISLYGKGRLKLALSPAPKEDVIVSLDRVSGFKRWLNR